MKNIKIANFLKLFSLIIILFLTACGAKVKSFNLKNTNVDAILLYEDNFEEGLENWKVEQMPGGIVEVKNSKLEINDVKGCTVWLKEKFEGPILIEYDVFLIDENGPNDRVSDLNCFWMATDPENPTDLFKNSEKRGGKFSNYDALQLYYMGVGGNNNSTTRFRRYVGNGERPLLDEHSLSHEKYMLEPNRVYNIMIVANNYTIQYYRDGVLFADFEDKQPYTTGYFGFRTVKNHMTVDNFKVYKIRDVK